MSGPLDRLIARVSGTEPAVRAAVPALFGDVSKDAEWSREVAEDQIESGRTIRGHPIRSQSAPAAPAKNPERTLAAPRAFEPAKPDASHRPPLRPQSEITDRAAVARLDPPTERPFDQSVQAVHTPLRWAVPPQVVQAHSPPVPAWLETASAPPPWAAAAAEPPAATAVPDTIVIEIGRIELSPPRPKQTPPPEVRRDRSVTLASDLADRRADKR